MEGGKLFLYSYLILNCLVTVLQKRFIPNIRSRSNIFIIIYCVIMVGVDGRGMTLPRYRDLPKRSSPTNSRTGRIQPPLQNRRKERMRENKKKVLLDTSLPGINSCSFYLVYLRHKQLNTNSKLTRLKFSLQLSSQPFSRHVTVIATSLSLPR